MWSLDPPNPGASDGQPFTVLITCADCDWRIRSDPPTAYTQAKEHCVERHHTMVFRGTVQGDLSPKKDTV